MAARRSGLKDEEEWKKRLDRWIDDLKALAWRDRGECRRETSDETTPMHTDIALSTFPIPSVLLISMELDCRSHGNYPRRHFPVMGISLKFSQASNLAQLCSDRKQSHTSGIPTISNDEQNEHHPFPS